MLSGRTTFERITSRCRALCRGLLTGAGASEKVAAQLTEQWVRHDDFLRFGLDLLAESEVLPADVVIGNPPYIRFDDLPDAVVAGYRRTWPMMRGRGDIYVVFIERALRTLTPGGRPILFERLVRERLYDAACLIASVKGKGIHNESAPEVSTQNLTAAIAGRVAYIRGLT